MALRSVRHESHALPGFDDLEIIALPVTQARELQSNASSTTVFRVHDHRLTYHFTEATDAQFFARKYRDQIALKYANPSNEFAVYAFRDGDGAYFWHDPQKVYSFRRSRLSASEFVFLADIVGFYELMRHSDLLSLHAAVVGDAAAAAAIVGISTAGKTTTAVACARGGMRYLSDERCVLKDGLVAPFLRAITLRSGSRALLRHDALPGQFQIDDDLAVFESAAEVTMPPSFVVAGKFDLAVTPLRSLFVIAGYAATPLAQPVSALSIVPALLKSTASRESGLPRIARLLRELAQVECYRLTLGTPAATADLIANRLKVDARTDV